MTNLALQLNDTKDIRNVEYRKQINGNILIDEYLKTLNTDNTRKAYARSINEFFKTLYPKEPLTLDMMVIDDIIAIRYMNIYKKKLNDGEIKSSTYNSKIKGIKSFYDWLMKRTRSNIYGYELLPFNPFDSTKQIAENDAEGSDALTPDEILLMLEHPYGHNQHVQMRNVLMFVLAITTGIRNSALLNIKEEDIKFLSGEWLVDAIDKENKQALMPINNYYTKLMAWYQNDKKWRTSGDTIFNIHPIYAGEVIKNWAKSVGIDKNITFHSLRATCAVQIYENSNGNLAKVQLALHHSNMSTSKIYAEKGNKINHDAENIVENILNIGKFESMVENLCKEDLVKILCSLDAHTKMQIMNRL
jgi:site-specific recombinase XerD